MRAKSWSAQVREKSNALDLEAGVFTWKDPKKIAQSLKNSALSSRRRRSSPYHSAMSMLNFFMNREGRKLPSERRRILELAKVELQTLFKQSG